MSYYITIGSLPYHIPCKTLEDVCEFFVKRKYHNYVLCDGSFLYGDVLVHRKGYKKPIYYCSYRFEISEDLLKFDFSLPF